MSRIIGASLVVGTIVLTGMAGVTAKGSVSAVGRKTVCSVAHIGSGS